MHTYIVMYKITVFTISWQVVMIATIRSLKYFLYVLSCKIPWVFYCTFVANTALD